MDNGKNEAAFLLRRAEEEAIRAIRNGHPNAAAAHFDLSLLYGARARAALTGEAAPRVLLERNVLQQH